MAKSEKDKLSEILGIGPLDLDDHIDKGQELVPIGPPKTQQEMEADDFALAREGIIESIEITQKAMHVLSKLAASAQSARAFEVLAKLADTLREGSKDLIGIHATKQQMDNPQPETINNTLVLTTSELLRIKKGGSVPDPE